jgi:protein SCO1/2
MKYLLRLLLIFYTGVVFADSTVEGESLYQLSLDLTDQHGEHIGLDVFRGQPVLIGMIYATCPYVCPLTVNTIQLTESELEPDQRKRLRVLLVSFDSENDTPERLAAVVKKQKVDDTRWALARADSDDVRKLAAVLGIRFRQLPDGEFNHSTVITLLDAEGVPVTSSNQLGHVDTELLSTIRGFLTGK